MTATLIPDPPLLDDGETFRLSSVDIRETVALGFYGHCCMCHKMCYHWWDLSRCGLEPVTGPDGTLTDQVCLHGDCVGSVIGYWVSMMSGEPVADEPQGDRGGSERGDSGDRFTDQAERDALMGGMYG